MLVRCDDCPTKFRLLPLWYWKPGGAIKFWIGLHGHIPRLYTFQCPVCKLSMQSGPEVAKREKWDTILLAQNDLGFWEEHKHGAILND